MKIKGKKLINISILAMIFIMSLLFLFSLKNNTINNKDIDPLKYIDEKSNDEDYILRNPSIDDETSSVIADFNDQDYLYVWGSNTRDEFGIPTEDKHKIYWNPTIVNAPNNEKIIKDAAFEKGMSYILTTDENGKDHLYTWGDNVHGSLGIDGEEDKLYDTPQEVLGLPEGNIKMVKSDTYGNINGNNFQHSFTLVVITDSSGVDHLYTWGDNFHSALGLGSDFTEDYYSTPQEVKTGPFSSLTSNDSIKFIDNGDSFSMAVVTISGVDHFYTWGHNSDGQLGDGSNDDSNHPIEVSLPPYESIKSLTAGDKSSGVVIENSEGTDDVYEWGFNGVNSYLGLGEEGDVKRSYYNTPQKNELLSNNDIKSLKLEDRNGSSIINDSGNDHLYVWGEEHGELGTKHEKSQGYEVFPSPKEVTILPEHNSLLEMNCGTGEVSSLLFINENGKYNIYSCGNNFYGSLGVGPIMTNSNVFVPVKSIISTPDSGTINHNEIKTTSAEFDFKGSEDKWPFSYGYKLNIKSDSQSFDWTSDILQSMNTSVIVNGFIPGETYSDFTIQPLTTFDIEIGESFKINDSFTTMSSDPVEITTLTIDDGSVGVSSFDFTATIKSSKEGETVLSDYKIEMIANVNDSTEEEVVWTSETQNGINLSLTVDNLISRTKYNNVKFQLIDSGDPSIKIGPVYETGKNIETIADDATGIETVVINKESIQKNSFTFNIDISTIVEGSKYINPVKIEAFAFIEDDTEKTNFWTSNTIDESSLEDVKIDGLTTATHYREIEFQLVSDSDESIKIGPSYLTNEDVKTLGNKAGELSDPYIDKITNDSANINVTVSKKETNNAINEYLQDYILVVTNGDTGDQWESGILDTSGVQTVTINGLESETTYDNLSIALKDTDISVDLDSFKTEGYPFAVNHNSFKVGKRNRNSFKFTIKIIFADWYTETFKTKTLHLYSNDSELNIEFIKNNGDDTYTYKAINLKHKTVYDNLEISLDGLEGRTFMNDTNGNPAYAKTTVNMILYNVLISLAVISIISLIIFLIWFNKKRDEEIKRMNKEIKELAKSKKV